MTEMQTPIKSSSYKGFDYFIVKSMLGAWLAYIDITDFPELQFKDTDEVDIYGLPFHGGCTYCGKTKHICDIEFNKQRKLIGCDWCHGTS